MSFGLSIYKHLLPRARAWRITVDKILRRFFEGLTGWPSDFIEYIGQIWTDAFPDTTRQLTQWENQFGLRDVGLSEGDRRSRLDATFKALGGQDLAYIEDTLQANGFDVYLHEWWVPGSDPPVARNPFDYITPTNKPLINIVTQAQRNFTVLCGEPLAACGEPLAECGEFDGIGFFQKDYALVDDPDLYPFYMYIGGETFSTDATVDATRQEEFEYLCLKLCPTQQYILLFVSYV